jgi:hypothetical protein
MKRQSPKEVFICLPYPEELDGSVLQFARERALAHASWEELGVCRPHFAPPSPALSYAVRRLGRQPLRTPPMGLAGGCTAGGRVPTRELWETVLGPDSVRGLLHRRSGPTPFVYPAALLWVRPSTGTARAARHAPQALAGLLPALSHDRRTAMARTGAKGLKRCGRAVHRHAVHVGCVRGGRWPAHAVDRLVVRSPQPARTRVAAGSGRRGKASARCGTTFPSAAETSYGSPSSLWRSIGWRCTRLRAGRSLGLRTRRACRPTATMQSTSQRRRGRMRRRRRRWRPTAARRRRASL